MTQETEHRPPPYFVTRKLPWLLAAAMLLVYLVTLDHGVTLENVGHLAELSGWNQLPDYRGAPVFFLLTLPLRWLPGGGPALALNLMAAICAGMTLILLARSVALLPQDRTFDQRLREVSENAILSIPTAWVPPLLAVVICGFQSTFWNNAMQGTGEMFDLLLFAYCIRGLLEYRLDLNESWIPRLALVYGLGIADSFAFIGFLPLFFGALVWIKGVSTFGGRTIRRLLGFGLLGVLPSLLYPLLYGFHYAGALGFWKTFFAVWYMDFKWKRDILWHFATYPTSISKQWLLIWAITSVIPTFVMGIRWKPYFGDTSPLGIFIATAVFHFVHAAFLLMCGWSALDAPFSPNHMYPRFPFLTFYYLGALSIGYYTGYFLLIFGTPIPTKGGHSRQRVNFLKRASNVSVLALLWIFIIATPVILVAKNWNRFVRHREAMAATQRYFDHVEQSLPAKDAVVLSDDSLRLALLHARLKQSGKEQSYLLLDTHGLSDRASYTAYMGAKRPQFKLATVRANGNSLRADQLDLVAMMQKLSEVHPIYYLQPSFGYYFENFYMRPHGLVYQLLTYPTNAWQPPSVGTELVAENQAFWKGAANDLNSLGGLLSPPKTGWVYFVKKYARLADPPEIMLDGLGQYYSRALNYWGVELEKQRQFAEAKLCFADATRLNPNNAAAVINASFNKKIQAGGDIVLDPTKAVEDTAEQFRGWTQILVRDGPFDEPNFRLRLAHALDHGRNRRQALLELLRVRDIAPDDILGPLELAQEYISIGQRWDGVSEYTPRSSGFSNALECARQAMRISPTNDTALNYACVAMINMKDYAGTLDLAEKVRQASPADETAIYFECLAVMSIPDYPRALALTRDILEVAPNNSTALFYRAIAAMQSKDNDLAIKTWDRLIQLQSGNYIAVLNRAVAEKDAGRLPEAKRDFETIAKVAPTSFQAYYGLGEIAYQEKDKTSAIKNYENYLKNYLQAHPTNKEPMWQEAKGVEQRLKELKSGGK